MRHEPGHQARARSSDSAARSPDTWSWHPSDPRDAEWVLARPLRQPRPGKTTTPLIKPARKAPSSLSMIVRRSSASSSSSSPLRGCGRSSLTPPARRREPGSCEEDPEEQSGQPGDTTQATRSDPSCLLTPLALMGADVSEFRLCILMQRSAFPFVISNVVRYTWLSTGTHPSGCARSPNRAPRCGDCSPSFCALLPGVQGQAVPGFGDNSRTRYGRVVRTVGPPGSGAVSVDISSPGSPRPAVRCGVPGRSPGRCWHPPGG